MRVNSFAAAMMFALGLPVTTGAQLPPNDPGSNDPRHSLKLPHVGGSSNLQVLHHIPLGGWSQVLGIEVEQELSRPYVYVARTDWDGDVSRSSKGIDIISVKDPANAKIIYSWRIPQGEIHQGT